MLSKLFTTLKITIQVSVQDNSWHLSSFLATFAYKIVKYYIKLIIVVDSFLKS
jgi:hypothetical protein